MWRKALWFATTLIAALPLLLVFSLLFDLGADTLMIFAAEHPRTTLGVLAGLALANIIMFCVLYSSRWESSKREEVVWAGGGSLLGMVMLITLAVLDRWFESRELILGLFATMTFGFFTLGASTANLGGLLYLLFRVRLQFKTS